MKLTKDTATYTTQLALVPDPRSTHTVQERQAALDLALKMSGTLTDMMFAVERMNSVRQGLDDRAGKLPAGDAVAKRLRAASAAVDVMRKKIVATKEGGMITGEERLRENLTDLYGAIVFYDGKPSQMQLDRTDAIGHELADVVAAFDGWSARDLAALNSQLGAKNLQPIVLITRTQWEGVGKSGQ